MSGYGPRPQIPKPCVREWPDHEWDDPDEDGHDCQGCDPDSTWRCDKAAHNIADWLRSRGLDYVKPSMEGSE
jgi:hypothetical protein